MKKLFTGLTIFLAIFTLTSCGDKDKPEEQPEDPQDSGVNFDTDEIDFANRPEISFKDSNEINIKDTDFSTSKFVLDEFKFEDFIEVKYKDEVITNYEAEFVFQEDEGDEEFFSTPTREGYPNNISIKVTTEDEKFNSIACELLIEDTQDPVINQTSIVKELDDGSIKLIIDHYEDLAEFQDQGIYKYLSFTDKGVIKLSELDIKITSSKNSVDFSQVDETFSLTFDVTDPTGNSIRESYKFKTTYPQSLGYATDEASQIDLFEYLDAATVKIFNISAFNGEELNAKLSAENPGLLAAYDFVDALDAQQRSPQIREDFIEENQGLIDQFNEYMDKPEHALFKDIKEAEDIVYKFRDITSVENYRDFIVNDIGATAADDAAIEKALENLGNANGVPFPYIKQEHLDLIENGAYDTFKDEMPTEPEIPLIYFPENRFDFSKETITYNKGSMGSGYYIGYDEDSDSLFVGTNHHVISGAENGLLLIEAYYQKDQTSDRGNYVPITLTGEVVHSNYDDTIESAEDGENIDIAVIKITGIWGGLPSGKPGNYGSGAYTFLQEDPHELVTEANNKWWDTYIKLHKSVIPNSPITEVLIPEYATHEGMNAWNPEYALTPGPDGEAIEVLDFEREDGKEYQTLREDDPDNPGEKIHVTRDVVYELWQEIDENGELVLTTIKDPGNGEITHVSVGTYEMYKKEGATYQPYMMDDPDNPDGPQIRKTGTITRYVYQEIHDRRDEFSFKHLIEAGIITIVPIITDEYFDALTLEETRFFSEGFPGGEYRRSGTDEFPIKFLNILEVPMATSDGGKWNYDMLQLQGVVGAGASGSLIVDQFGNIVATLSSGSGGESIGASTNGVLYTSMLEEYERWMDSIVEGTDKTFGETYDLEVFDSVRTQNENAKEGKSSDTIDWTNEIADMSAIQ